MEERAIDRLKHPIHDLPGTSWTLVFHTPTAFWCVEEVQAEPYGLKRTPLDAFSQSETGIAMSYWLTIAMRQAHAD
jgi:hypothetical protein